ncbi:uncharacterized protein [Setaria viridis]|uniref:uncharacterized protein n=1 Tax=Setaria viridis TaxID=4556 RepID=UPI003B3A59E1
MGRTDNEEDRSPSPDLAGPRTFSARILNAPFPARFRQPTNVAKYSEETNPGFGSATTGLLVKLKVYECDVECCEYAAAITCMENPVVRLAESAKDLPDSKQSTISFEATEGVKEVPLDPSSTDGRTVRIGATLSPK